MCEHLVLKDYNNEILETNKHAHLNTFYELVGDFYMECCI